VNVGQLNLSNGRCVGSLDEVLNRSSDVVLTEVSWLSSAKARDKKRAVAMSAMVGYSTQTREAGITPTVW
jgi:hypothetical protein